MSQYTEQEIAQMRAKDKRDDHAHARIDALQKVIASLEELHGHDPGPAKARMAKADKQAEQKLGLR